ncbi:SRPBCC family protein [Arthrobacter sp. HLT1-20]
MELKHHFTVPSSLADTWHSFNQLEEIAPCFPGATLTSVEGDSFTGTVKIKLGPIAMLYAGTGEFVSRDESTHTVVIQATGKDKRGNGTAGATVTAVLAADGDGTTVDVSTDMNVTGKPAQFGRGVIQDISDKLLEQFVQCVIDKAGAVAEPVETPAAPSPAAAQAPAPPTPTPASAPELDLGSAVLPVLARRFGPAVLGAAAVLAVIICLCRRKGKGNRR